MKALKEAQKAKEAKKEAEKTKAVPKSAYTKDIKKALNRGYVEISKFLSGKISSEEFAGAVEWENEENCWSEAESVSERREEGVKINIYVKGVSDSINIALKRKLIDKKQYDRVKDALSNIR